MKIMIDAGHGYETAGKRTVDGMKEYQFNRAVANEMKRLLKNYQQVTCLFSHSDKEDIPLKNRVAQANQTNADLFISIHANAHGNGKQWTSSSGIETYVYTSKPKKAYELALLVQEELIRKTARKDRGVKTANFFVLKETVMTAILCECGFMTNQLEANLLRTAAYQMTCAEAIVDAIASYYHLESRKKENQPANLEVFFKVQTGAFKNRKNAEKLVRDLKQNGYEAIIVASKQE